MGYRLKSLFTILLLSTGCSHVIRSVIENASTSALLRYTGSNSVQLYTHQLIQKPSMSEGNIWRKIGVSDSGRVFTLDEMMNPNDFTWSIIPAMNSTLPYGNYGTTFVKLATDQFLLVGNGGWNSAPANTELFNPDSVTWQQAANLNFGRNYPNANLLADGKVLVTSGNGAAGIPIGTAEIYDPLSNAWTLRASNILARKDGASALLNNNNLLFCGGTINTLGTTTDTCEIYNPTANTWTSTGNINIQRAYHEMVTLHDGRVLLMGGDVPNPPNSSEKTEIYNPDTGTWSFTGPLATTRTYLGYVLLRDGRVLVAGGYNWAVNWSERLDTIEIFDPNTNNWTLSSAHLSVKRTDKPVPVELANGSVLIVGGYDTVSSNAIVDLGTHFTEELSLSATGGSGNYSYTLMSGPGRVNGNKYFVGVSGVAQIKISDGTSDVITTIEVLSP